jgi:DNA mismatch repair protein MutS
VPRPVLARATQVLTALETRARTGGPDALAAELPLFADSRPAAAAPEPSALHAALAALDLDSLSPREAQDALYHLKSLAENPAATQHDEAVAAPHKSVS